jgi:oligopeptide/dipeptide ABC transporter ATP-binding protein
MQVTNVTGQNIDSSSILDRAKERGSSLLRTVASNPKIALGVGVVAFFVLMAIAAPLLTHYDPNASVVKGSLPPSSAHILGTTGLGQDLFAQLAYGARVTLLVGFVAAIGSTLLQVLMGLSSAYFGGIVDEVLSLVINVFLVLPGLPLTIVLASLASASGANQNEHVIALVLMFTSWSYGARVLRAQTLSLKEREFVSAARASGESSLRIISTEILPNEVSLIASTFIGTFVYAVGAEVALEFLGLGNTSRASWGVILYWAQNNAALIVGKWWQFVPAGLCIAVLCAGLTFINFGIDELANPRLRAESPRRKRLSSGKKQAGSDAVTPEVAVRSENASSQEQAVLLEVKHLDVYYETESSPVHAVNDVSFTLYRGQILGLAGESGSGKSTLAYAITRLLHTPATVSGGEIWYYPRDDRSFEIEKLDTQESPLPSVKRKERDTGSAPINVLELSPAQLRAFRWQELAIVFQSAMNALNPVIRLEGQITDVLKAHAPSMGPDERRERALELLRLVGITPDRLRSYPHELSGGMRQRAIIAIALALNPDIIIMDEPTTALDVVVQRDILVELMALRERLNFAVIFITHDLSLLLEIADQVVIMYAGRIVETASWQEIYRYPRHPYTYGLLNSFPSLHGPRNKMDGIPGSPPDLRNAPAGCAFHPRCPFAFDACRDREPILAIPRITGVHVGERGLEPDGTLEGGVLSTRSHKCQVACHLYHSEQPSTRVEKALQLALPDVDSVEEGGEKSNG